MKMAWLKRRLAHTFANLSFIVLLALYAGQQLCIDFFVSRANFLIILRSHLDVTCLYSILSSLFNVDVNYNYIYKFNYKCSLKYIE